MNKRRSKIPHSLHSIGQCIIYLNFFSFARYDTYKKVLDCAAHLTLTLYTQLNSTDFCGL